jgi:hypothetical protein
MTEEVRLKIEDEYPYIGDLSKKDVSVLDMQDGIDSCKMLAKALYIMYETKGAHVSTAIYSMLKELKLKLVEIENISHRMQSVNP